jgi:hypothetical protein
MHHFNYGLLKILYPMKIVPCIFSVYRTDMVPSPLCRCPLAIPRWGFSIPYNMNPNPSIGASFQLADMDKHDTAVYQSQAHPDLSWRGSYMILALGLNRQGGEDEPRYFCGFNSFGVASAWRKMAKTYSSFTQWDDHNITFHRRENVRFLSW